MRVAIDQRLILEAIRRISDAQLIQLVDEAARKGGLKATPKDDDTFLNDEKGCLFLLTASALLRKPLPPGCPDEFARSSGVSWLHRAESVFLVPSLGLHQLKH